MVVKISEAQVKTLEFQTVQAFNALDRAFSTRDIVDIFWARDLYEGINKTIETLAGEPRRRNGNMPEKEQFNKYLKQVQIGLGAVSGLEPKNFSYRGKDYTNSPQNMDNSYNEESLRGHSKRAS